MLDKPTATTETALLRCDVCQKEFTGRPVLDDHLRGAKHARMVKAREVMGDLKAAGQLPPDGATSFPCSTCDLVLNSSLQLASHLSGARHRQAATTAGRGRVPRWSSAANDTPNTQIVGRDNGDPPGSESTGADKPSDAKPVALRCNICGITTNSATQQKQHLESRKHADRAAGRLAFGASRPFGLSRGRGFPQKGLVASPPDRSCTDYPL